MFECISLARVIYGHAPRWTSSVTGAPSRIHSQSMLILNMPTSKISIVPDYQSHMVSSCKVYSAWGVWNTTISICIHSGESQLLLNWWKKGTVESQPEFIGNTEIILIDWVINCYSCIQLVGREISCFISFFINTYDLWYMSQVYASTLWCYMIPTRYFKTLPHSFMYLWCI